MVISKSMNTKLFSDKSVKGMKFHCVCQNMKTLFRFYVAAGRIRLPLLSRPDRVHCMLPSWYYGQKLFPNKFKIRDTTILLTCKCGKILHQPCKSFVESKIFDWLTRSSTCLIMSVALQKVF